MTGGRAAATLAEPIEPPCARLLRAGARALSDAELVAVVLRNGRPGRTAVEVAGDLLAKTGGFPGLAGACARRLRSVAEQKTAASSQASRCPADRDLEAEHADPVDLFEDELARRLGIERPEMPYDLWRPHRVAAIEARGSEADREAHRLEAELGAR